MTLSLDDIPPLSADSRSSARDLVRTHGAAERLRTDRRQFISAVAAGSVAVGGAFLFTLGRAEPAAAVPPAGYGDLKPGATNNPCTAGNGGPSVSATFYANNPPEIACGPSAICNTYTFLGGCADGPYHRYYWPGGSDAWKYRPDQCPPNTSYDRWQWYRSNFSGCGRAIINCHDGWKIIQGETYPTIRAGFMGCA